MRDLHLFLPDGELLVTGTVNGERRNLTAAVGEVVVTSEEDYEDIFDGSDDKVATIANKTYTLQAQFKMDEKGVAYRLTREGYEKMENVNPYAVKEETTSDYQRGHDEGYALGFEEARAQLLLEIVKVSVNL